MGSKKKKKSIKRIQRKKSKKSKHNKASYSLFDRASLYTIQNAPVYKVLIPKNLFELGMGNVVFSRKLNNGQIALSVFLVDIYCLGVKNALAAIVFESEFYEELDRLEAQSGPLTNIHQSCARKLVEGAVSYALDLGFSPHKDYKTAKLIFSDIDPEACPENFEYGKDGKPLFVSGPFDSKVRCDKILGILEKRCGPNGYHYIIEKESFDELF